MKQLYWYAFVGLMTNTTAYLIYLLLTHMGLTPKITMSILYGAAATIGFFGNRRLTFGHNGSVFKTAIRYILSHFLGYCINLSILIIMVDKLKYDHQVIQAIAIFIVAGFLFLLFKFFVFKNDSMQI